MLVDPFRRTISYVRLSVTDRCNLRCVYCVPEGYRDFAPPSDVLRDGEIDTLMTCLAGLGVSKIRITGGEPLIRPGLERLIGRLSRIPGVDDIALSTNGLLLGRMAGTLRDAGLGRVNVSLDTLDPDRFRRITRHGDLGTVLEGLEAAVAAGLSPVKLNVVVARGMNDDEIGRFARITEEHPVHVRFIELMPMGESGFFSRERWVPLHEIRERAGPIEPLDRDRWPIGHGPATCFRRPGAKGTLGFISALSGRFCASCNRVRLSARGVLIPCLDATEGTDLRALLRRGAGRAEIERAILRTIERKPERHTMAERVAGVRTGSRFMCQIGG
jgi:cyclic pyranopterin phosphate synthase